MLAPGVMAARTIAGKRDRDRAPPNDLRRSGGHPERRL
jgi:hypothetical protein